VYISTLITCTSSCNHWAITGITSVKAQHCCCHIMTAAPSLTSSTQVLYCYTTVLYCITNVKTFYQIVHCPLKHWASSEISYNTATQQSHLLHTTIKQLLPTTETTDTQKHSTDSADNDHSYKSLDNTNSQSVQCVKTN